MDEKLLCQIGLTANQAHVYRLLVERKSLRPAQLVKITRESRANCYALLDKLVDMGLALRIDVDKKLTYYPESPVVLQKILNEQIAEAQSKLQATQRALPRMLSAFNNHPAAPRIKSYQGKDQLRQMYMEQMETTDTQVHFIRSVHDVPFFGYETMRDIRYLATHYHKRRTGISPVVLYGTASPARDAKGNLRRTWLPKGSYTAPVEWAVSGDTLHIINFSGDGHGVSIKNPQIADAMRQIIELFSTYIRKDPDYESTPREFKLMHEQHTLQSQINTAQQEATKAATIVPAARRKPGRQK